MNRLAVVAAFACAVAISAPVSAQSCQGYTPFSVAPLRMNGNLVFHSNTEYGGSLAAGHAKPGLFGEAAVSGMKTVGSDQTIKAAAVYGGFSFPVPTAMTGLEFCPVAAYEHVWYPDRGGPSVSGNNVNIGGAFGWSIVASPTVNVVPFGDLRFVRANISNGTGGFSSNSGALVLGAGIVFSRQLTLRPALLIPVHRDGAPTDLAISVGYSFGK